MNTKTIVGVVSAILILSLVVMVIRGYGRGNERADTVRNLPAQPTVSATPATAPAATPATAPATTYPPRFFKASHETINRVAESPNAAAQVTVGTGKAAEELEDGWQERERARQQRTFEEVRERMQPHELAQVRYELEQAKEEVLRIKDKILWQQKEIEKAARDRVLLNQSLAQNARTDSPGVKMIRRQEVKMRDDYLESTKNILVDMQQELQKATQEVVRLEALLQSKTKTTH